MYQVIRLFGDFEAWWFLDGWEEDIVSCETFESLTEAVAFYKQEREGMLKEFSQKEEQSDQMAAFWNPEEQRWCEECGENLQQFHSLFILSESESIIPLHSAERGHAVKGTICRLKKIAE